MGAYQDINIGPFVGGLNTLSDQTSISDTELFQCENFELDQDGSLVSRPPVRKMSTLLASTKALKLLGYFIDSTSQAVYLIGTDRTGNTYYLSSGNWVLLTDTFAATACLQFRDKLYLVAPLSSANPGGTWTPGGGFVADAAMPKGACIVRNKERLWIAQGKDATSNGSRVYVTDIGTGGALTWSGNFISVSTGDGENVVDLCVYNSDLVIFKQRSTWRFAFGSDPASGYFTNLSQTIGANDTGCWCAFEDQLFLIYNNAVYEFTNYNFNRINVTVPLEAQNLSASLTEAFNISAWSYRILVSYFDTLYVYNLKNRTWSTWKSSRIGSFGRFFALPGAQSSRPVAYLYSTQPAGTAGDVANGLYQVVDLIEAGLSTDATASESFTCTLETKNYDYQSPSKWKRLAWWGIDILSRSTISVWAQPVQYAQTVTWGQLFAGYTWGGIYNAGGTWGRPTEISYTVSDTVTSVDISTGRKLIKFLKSLRFRQISFRIQATTYGTSDSAPVRLYRISTRVKDKQTVSKKVN